MIFIGVTGGIGSGKSTVCLLFQKKNVPIFFADAAAKDIAENDALPLIVHEFGTKILNSSKALDRKALAEIVFNNDLHLQKLNAIVHPLVFTAFEKWKKSDFGEARYALVEAALLFESGMFEMTDYVLAVLADEQKRIQRVISRDNTSEDHVIARMEHQLSIEELHELSDFQINNNESLTELTSKVNFFHSLFSTLTSRKDEE